MEGDTSASDPNHYTLFGIRNYMRDFAWHQHSTEKNDAASCLAGVAAVHFSKNLRAQPKNKENFFFASAIYNNYII